MLALSANALSSGAAHALSPRLAGLFNGVSAEVVGGESKVLLKGTVERVEQVKAWLQELLAEAEGCAVQIPINRVQWDKLMLRQGRERIELYRKLQDAHECVLHAERCADEGGVVTRVLSMRGRAIAVARVQQELDTALDVDEQVRIVQTQASLSNAAPLQREPGAASSARDVIDESH